MRRLGVWLLALAPLTRATAQHVPFTHADTLRGSISPERIWWDVTFYDLHVTIDPSDSTVHGWNGITYRVTGRPRAMQVDLQTPLDVDSMVQDGRRLRYRRDGNAFIVTLAAPQPMGATKTLTVYYHGKPHAAVKPPWDGGLIWAHDSAGHPWISTACQGLGPSVWWPTKDTQADEPDSQRIALTIPDSLGQAVANGRLRAIDRHDDGWTTYEWFVTEPINNYDVAAYVGRYAHFTDDYEGEGGRLTLGFWSLPSHLDTARVQFAQTRPMLQCFEHWFGPYPWYRDGYQLVEAPHLGMEHQSAVAYGNGYHNGYKGRDLSGTGWGLTWDFILVHESAHEWFGNSITTADIADMWVHESFANYAESLFTECRYGGAAGAAYVIGTRAKVQNDRPIVGPYGVNAEGSGDMYYKGGNMLHTVRHIIGNDSTWRSILRGLNTTFRHRIVTGKQVEEYMSEHAGVDLSRVFAQYLTTTQIPVFEYQLAGDTLNYRWVDVVPGFDMPLRVSVGPDRWVRLAPRQAWQTTTLPLAGQDDIRVDENFYVLARRTRGGRENDTVTRPLDSSSSGSRVHPGGVQQRRPATGPHVPPAGHQRSS
jgi:aminopeptidase N